MPYASVVDPDPDTNWILITQLLATLWILTCTPNTEKKTHTVKT